MEFVVNWIDAHGINAAGWIVSLFLAWHFFKKMLATQEKTTDTLVEITKVSAVQQEQIKSLRDDVNNLNTAVFIVNYPAKKK